MIGDILQPTHLLFVLVIALLVLGPKRLPEVGRSLGRGIRDFRSAIGGEDDPPAPLGTSTTTAAPAEPAAEPVPATQPVPQPAPTEPAAESAPVTHPMPPAAPVEPTS